MMPPTPHDELVKSIQQLQESGQLNDPRYQQLISLLQAQQSGGSFQGIGNSGRGLSGPVQLSAPPRVLQDVAAVRVPNWSSSSNSLQVPVSSIGASDSGHGSQLHAQTYLQHALLAAQQKAQVNAFSQQKVSKPLPQAVPHDHSGPSNLQGMMQQQQHQQAGQQNSTVVQQSTSSEKLRDQAHPSKQAWNDSKSLPHPQGSLQRPTSGPVQGISTHHQRVQNSMNAQFGSMASPPQLSHAPSPQSNGQLPSQGQNPPQGQIPPQYLPQLQGCFVAMHKAAGQGGVGMSQARPLAPVSQDRGVGADPSALATITSGPASGGLHNPGVMYSSMQQGQAGSTSSAPILTSNFVAFHPVSQGGDSRMLHSGSRHQPSGAKGTKLEASAGNIAHSGSSGPMQQASQVAPTQAPRPSLLSGAGAEGQVASQLPLQQQQQQQAGVGFTKQQQQQQQAGVGFTKQQLVVLRNQIMAFKRLKTRKVDDAGFSEEIARLINAPSRTAQQNLQVGSASVSKVQNPNVAPVVKVSEPSVNASNGTQVSMKESDRKPLDLSTKKAEPQVLREVGKKEVEGQTVAANVTSRPSSFNRDDAKGAVGLKQETSVPVEVKAESSAQLDSSRKVETSITKKGTVDAVGTTTGTDNTSSKSTALVVPVPPSFQKAPHKVQPFRGPLFDFPPVGTRIDGRALSLNAQASLWGQPISLGYNVRTLLLEEGVRVIDKKRAEKLNIMEDLLTLEKGKNQLQPDQVVKLRIEQRKLRLMELQARIRDEVEEQQQEIMAMGERVYRKFVRLCERQRMDLARQVLMLQRTTREKHLKSLFQWRKKLLEAQWVSRDARITRNRGVAKCHERMLREFSKRKDEDRNRRMEALKNNDVDAYREILRQQQTQLPGDAGERFEVLSAFLTQTEEYLHKLGGKISAVKNQQEREEAALAAAAAARARGLSDVEVEEAALRAGEEISANGYVSKPSQDSSVNRYYSLAHAVHEQILKQPSMLCAGILRDYQLVGLQWMLSLYNNRLNGILADEMGLGKTVQVMALIAYLMEFKGNYGPHLIIVPNAVIVNWKSELLRWLPSVSCIFYVGGKEQRAKIYAQEVCAMKFNVMVTTYEFIMRDRAKLSKVEWKYMIIDEAQRMKDRESRLARDLDRFSCQRRLLLTGTPLQNDLHELWSLLNLLLPEVFDNSKAFHEWFSTPFQKEAVQAEEDDWLETEKKVIVIHRLHQILEPFMLRRRVEDVEGSLPPKVSVVLKCKMSAFQAAIYDWIKVTGTIRLDPEDEAQRVAGNSKRQARAFAPLQNKCMELRKVCNHPCLNYPPRGHLLNDNVVRMCGKLWILDRILVKLHRTGHRVLLFSTMTRLLDILEDYLQWRRLMYRRIDGTTSLDGREAAIVEFNRPGSEVFIFLLSIRAAGRGLNLQSADTVVIYDPDPNPKNEEQAVARAHRIGQKREVRVIYMEAVVEHVPSFEKEDELRSGGNLDEDGDEMAGKDRYVGSVETLVRNNIQQHKIDMADEVINAGRFDQRTTQEERRLTLEALLHDEERYQQTVHDVPTLQEVNRMIARTDEEVEIFDRMDEENGWPGELIPYHKVPKWLRVGSIEVNSAVAATSKEAMKRGFVEAVGTCEAEEKLLAKGTKRMAKEEPKYSRSRTVDRKRRKLEEERVVYEDVDDEEFEEEREAVIEKALKAADADDEEEEEGEIDEEEDQDEVMVEQEGEQLEEEEEVIEEVIEEVEEEVEEGEDIPLPYLSSDDGELSPVQPHRPATVAQSKKFASLSALEGRPSRPEESDDLEEGEIAASGDSSAEQRSETWVQGQEELEEEEGEGEDQVILPQNKRKRSKSHHRRIVHLHGLGERDTSNGSLSDQRGSMPTVSLRLNPKSDQRMMLWSDIRGDEHLAQQYDQPDQWGTHSKKRHLNPPDVHKTVRPRIVFKHSWVNGLQEPGEDVDVDRDIRTAKSLHQRSLGNWGTGGGHMPENQQKKCKAVLGKLQGAMNKEGRQIAALFMELPKHSEVPDYYKVIARPISAHTIEERLDRFEYASVLEFAADVHLMLGNAARFHSDSLEVQADARRLQALFERRMGLMFPDVDFTSVRVRSTVGTPTPVPSSTGIRGARRLPLITAEAAKPLMLNSSTTDPQSSARVTLVRRTPLDDDSPTQEKKSHKGKKSKKEGKETIEEKKIKEKKVKEKKIKEKKSIKSISSAKSDANKCSIKEREQFLGKDDLDDGILHPVDLVIQRKKRKGREQKGVVRAVSLQGVSNSGVPKSSGAAAAVGATMSANSRKFLQAAPGWGAQFAASPSIGQASGSQQQHQQDGKGGVVTVLKKLRTDGGKRRPSRT